jgi:signal peptidase I
MRRALLVVLLLAGCKERFKQASSSMMPTIEIDERIAITKGTPERGDVIVFDQPCEPQRQYVKRAIAMGGDTVEVRCGVVYVNGKAIDHSLVAASTTYEDRFDDQVTKREVSRYRETHNGHTYEIFDDISRPAAKEPGFGLKDFPQRDELPSCGSMMGATAKGGPAGKLVKLVPDPEGCKPHTHFVVPADTIFVLGDNRSNSNDSRYWGVVPMASVRGKVD